MIFGQPWKRKMLIWGQNWRMASTDSSVNSRQPLMCTSCLKKLMFNLIFHSIKQWTNENGFNIFFNQQTNENSICISLNQQTYENSFCILFQQQTNENSFCVSFNSKPIKTALTIDNETSGCESVIHTFKHCLHAPVAMCMTPASVIYWKNSTTNNLLL